MSRLARIKACSSRKVQVWGNFTPCLLLLTWGSYEKEEKKEGQKKEKRNKINKREQTEGVARKN